MAEAWIGMDEKDKGKTILQEAYEMAPESWMKESIEG